MIAGNRLGTAGSTDARVLRRRSDASTLSCSLVLVLALLAVDLTDVLDTGPSARYLILLPPLLAVLMLWGSVRLPFTRRATSSDRVLLVLFAWGLAGTVIGKTILGTETSALPIFLPMALGLVHLWAIEELADEEAARLVRWLSLVGLVYVALHALASSALIPSLSAAGSYTHPKAFLIALALTAALLTHRRVRFVLLVTLAVVIFVAYPAATYLAGAATAAATVFATGPRATPRRGLMIGVIVATLLAIAFLNLRATSEVVDEYFRDVGKPSNVDTRLDLWREGLRQVPSPLLGSSFAGEMTVPFSLDGRTSVQLALHNDYLQLALGGGVVAVALFLGWAVATNVLVIRRLRMLWHAERRDHATLLRILLAAYNTWMCIALFNPLLQSIGTSAALFAMYGLLMLAAVPALQPTIARA